jgi:hypothetical protein
MKIAYAIEIGGQSLSSQKATGSSLVALEVERGMGGAGGRCGLRLRSTGGTRPTAGDPLRVELDAGRGLQAIFTGEIQTIRSEVETWGVQGRDGLGRLAELELEKSYEEVSAGFIVKDLVDAAGAEGGELDDGPSFPRYLLHGGIRALQHAQRLGALIGADLYTDGEGRIHFRRPVSQPARHRLRWSEDVLDLELVHRERIGDSIDVWGEGAAGTDGAEREHWLPTDLGGVRGQATLEGEAGSPRVAVGRLGQRARIVVDGAIRSVDAAEDVAAALVQAQALRPLAGSVLLPGLADVEPGDWIELLDLPPGIHPSSAGAVALRVRRIWHFLSPSQGLLTRLGF